jgi:hypothetical protein
VVNSTHNLVYKVQQGTCQTENCASVAKVRGLCMSCYRKARRRGMPRIADDYATRFWLRVTKTETCWLWDVISPKARYGHFHAGGKVYQAHAFAYKLLVGSVPDGCEFDHLCRNRGCVNPAHLEPVPHRINVLRGEGPCAKNARKTHCKHGHPLTPDNLVPGCKWRQCKICKDGWLLTSAQRRKEKRVAGRSVH